MADLQILSNDEKILNAVVLKSIKRSQQLFADDYYKPLIDDEDTEKIGKKCREISNYSQFMKKEGSVPSNATVGPQNQLAIPLGVTNPSLEPTKAKNNETIVPKRFDNDSIDKVVERVMEQAQTHGEKPLAEDIKVIAEKALMTSSAAEHTPGESLIPFSQGLVPRKAVLMPKPSWHPPWKLMRVISGHTGWVRCMTVEPGNVWFATGSCDRMIKIWDLATGTLKLSLTGHISTVRGVVASHRHPYLFSCGEDKTIKCWDLEQNKAIRHYHGHLHSIYCIAQHPTIDVIVTGSRDATCRVWDIRTKACAFTLTGHTNTVASLCVQAAKPQVVSGSHDSTIRLWDLTAGKPYSTLTNHKKSVRSVILHPKLNCMCSASPETIKEWKLPDGELMQTLKGQNAIINAMAMNEDDVLVSGGDNGSLYFWDWKTGYNFDSQQTIVQPGSLDSEACIYALGFDLSGSRLISCEADKSIKIFKEDDQATEESHPIKFNQHVVRPTKY